MTTIATPIEFVTSVADLRFPSKIDAHLQALMDRNTEGQLSASECEELEALVELSETISLLRVQALRVRGRTVHEPLTTEYTKLHKKWSSYGSGV